MARNIQYNWFGCKHVSVTQIHKFVSQAATSYCSTVGFSSGLWYRSKVLGGSSSKMWTDHARSKYPMVWQVHQSPIFLFVASWSFQASCVSRVLSGIPKHADIRSMYPCSRATSSLHNSRFCLATGSITNLTLSKCILFIFQSISIYFQSNEPKMKCHSVQPKHNEKRPTTLRRGTPTNSSDRTFVQKALDWIVTAEADVLSKNNYCSWLSFTLFLFLAYSRNGFVKFMSTDDNLMWIPNSERSGYLGTTTWR